MDLGGTRGDFGDSDSVPTASVAELIGQDLGHIDVPFEVNFAEVSTTDWSTGESLVEIAMPCPDYTADLYLNGMIEGYVTAGTGQWRLVNSSDTLNGTWRDITTTGGHAEQTADKVQIGSSPDVDSTTTIQIWGKASGVGETTYLRCDLGLTFWFSSS